MDNARNGSLDALTFNTTRGNTQLTVVNPDITSSATQPVASFQQDNTLSSLSHTGPAICAEFLCFCFLFCFFTFRNHREAEICLDGPSTRDHRWWHREPHELAVISRLDISNKPEFLVFSSVWTPSPSCNIRSGSVEAEFLCLSFCVFYPIFLLSNPCASTRQAGMTGGEGHQAHSRAHWERMSSRTDQPTKMSTPAPVGPLAWDTQHWETPAEAWWSTIFSFPVRLS